MLGLSAHHFSMLFKQTFGTSPHRYVLLERIRESQKLLASSRRRIPISAVALEMGFADQSHFTHVFRTITGTTPGRYQRNC